MHAFRSMRYPVHYHVTRPARFARVQLAARLVAFIALGVVGVSFGAVFVFLYLGLPAFTAARLGERDRDVPRIVHALSWIAAISAWTGLVIDHVPTDPTDGTIELAVTPTANPTAGSAIARVITGIPSALVLALLGFIGSFVWLWAALSVLFVERVGEHAFAYLVGLQRWSIRLLAYQASLVDEYPPFSFADAEPAVPAATALR
jgi:hypothetical protein